MLDWDKYISMAERFQYKAEPQDRGDLKHNIILALAQAQLRNSDNGDNRLTEGDMLRTARYECQKYWRSKKRHLREIDLETSVHNDDGNITRLVETVPDTKVIDYDARIDARSLLGCYPSRVLNIAWKITRGIVLSNKEHQYLWRFRHRTINRKD